ncbi:MAG: Crp/Fnr family transcriptional regulator [Dongiaceae bacterium]
MLKKPARGDVGKIVESIGNGHSFKQYRRGQHVFRQKDPADAVYYLKTGRIQITAISDQGKEGVVSVMEPEDFFGEGCLAGQALHSANASAVADSTIMRIEKDTMVRMLQDNSAFSRLFMRFLLSRNIQIEETLVKQLFNSSEMRLARVLLQLADFGKNPKLDEVVPLANIEILAARVGTTVARIDYFMDRFQKLGFIELNGGMRVHASLLSVIVNE